MTSASYYVTSPGYPLSLINPAFSAVALVAVIVVAWRLHRHWLWAAAPLAVPLVVIAWSLMGVRKFMEAAEEPRGNIVPAVVGAAGQWGCQLSVMLTLVALVFIPRPRFSAPGEANHA